MSGRYTYMIVRRVDGNYAVMDESDDAPLVTILFHNEAARIPDEMKRILIRQMFDPAPKMPGVERFAWVMLGILAGFVTMMLSGLVFGWARK